MLLICLETVERFEGALEVEDVCTHKSQTVIKGVGGVGKPPMSKRLAVASAGLRMR